jgi:hypothetical protein
MAKLILIFLIITNILYGQNIYEKNCISCHKKLPVNIDKFFYRYLLEYSSERKVKEKMFTFLLNPKADSSMMGKAFIKRFKIKEKSLLSEKQLKEAIDIYWEKYKVFGKLK